jgi:hypothetical protein
MKARFESRVDEGREVTLCPWIVVLLSTEEEEVDQMRVGGQHWRQGRGRGDEDGGCRLGHIEVDCK